MANSTLGVLEQDGNVVGAEAGAGAGAVTVAVEGGTGLEKWHLMGQGQRQVLGF